MCGPMSAWVTLCRAQNQIVEKLPLPGWRRSLACEETTHLEMHLFTEPKILMCTRRKAMHVQIARPSQPWPNWKAHLKTDFGIVYLNTHKPWRAPL